MPIVTPGSNPKIVLDAYVDKTDFDEKVKSIQTRLGVMQDKLTQQADRQTQATKTSTMSLTDFRSAYGIVMDVIRAGEQVYDATIKKELEYTDAIRELSNVSQTSATESSRLIQVLDDYGISANDALTSAKALKNEGYVPTIETLAKLSDQYLAITDPAEKYAFAQKNLGRNSKEYLELLEKGSTAIVAQGAAVDQSLLRNEKQLENARKLKISQDTLNESWEKFTGTVATKVIPALTSIIDAANDEHRAQELAKEDGKNLAFMTTDQIAIYLDLAAAEREQATALMLATGASQENTISTEENIAAQKELSDHLSGMIGLVGSIQKADEDYTEKSKDLADDRAETLQKLAELRAQGYSEQSTQVQDELSKLDEIKNKEAELAAARDEQTLQFISNILAENLARDGWTQAEFDAFAKQQEAWGLWSADVVAKAQAAWMEADKITASINAIPTEKNVNINVTENRTSSGGGSGVSNDSTLTGTQSHGHASGGDFLIPMSYGHEGFKLGNGDTASGGETVSVGKSGSNNQSNRNDNSDVVAEIRRLPRLLKAAIMAEG